MSAALALAGEPLSAYRLLAAQPASFAARAADALAREMFVADGTLVRVEVDMRQRGGPLFLLSFAEGREPEYSLADAFGDRQRTFEAIAAGLFAGVPGRFCRYSIPRAGEPEYLADDAEDITAAGAGQPADRAFKPGAAVTHPDFPGVVGLVVFWPSEHWTRRDADADDVAVVFATTLARASRKDGIGRVSLADLKVVEVRDVKA